MDDDFIIISKPKRKSGPENLKKKNIYIYGPEFFCWSVTWSVAVEIHNAKHLMVNIAKTVNLRTFRK